MSPGKTEVKQGKFVEFISPAKGYFRETYESQNINPISPTPKFTLCTILISDFKGVGGGVCRQHICYHVAALVIPFNLM